jgi:hypothetical protein
VILEELVQQANAICQFSQRRSELTAERFVQVLVLGWLQQADASLNTLAHHAQGLGSEFTGAALHERIGTAAVELLGRVLVGAIRRVASVSRLPVPALGCFTGVYVTDSTQVGLPQSMVAEFRGNSGNAMLKLQVTLDYLMGQWMGCEWVEGRSPDQNCDLALRHAVAGSLNLFDLGSFKQERLRDLDAQGAYFVSRYQSQTARYDPQTGERFELVSWLQSQVGDAAECVVELGSRVQLPLRLVARRVSPQVAAQRRRQAKQRAREQGKTCSPAYRYLLGWDILISNLPAETWSLEQLFALYPIRTQIEWLFRVWKSHLKLTHLGNWRPERVLCQLYAHLIGAVLCHRLTAGWHWRGGIEYSLYKCVQIIQQHIAQLMSCIAHAWRGFRTWQRQLEAAFHRFGRKTQRRKAPSTCQILLDWSLS